MSDDRKIAAVLLHLGAFIWDCRFFSFFDHGRVSFILVAFYISARTDFLDLFSVLIFISLVFIQRSIFAFMFMFRALQLSYTFTQRYYYYPFYFLCFIFVSLFVWCIWFPFSLPPFSLQSISISFPPLAVFLQVNFFVFCFPPYITICIIFLFCFSFVNPKWTSESKWLRWKGKIPFTSRFFMWMRSYFLASAVFSLLFAVHTLLSVLNV